MSENDARSAAPQRRGRPRQDEVESRRERVLDAAVEELVERGDAGLTMSSVAIRASASKATLYAWWGSREGLLSAVVRRNADQAAIAVREALHSESSVSETLVRFASGLLRLLTGPVSVALNRAAMTTPSLAELLLVSGRYRVGPLVEGYLAEQHRRGAIRAPDPAGAFRLLYGLIVEDIQIRVLLGEEPPDDAEIREQARRSVDRFLHLSRPDD